MSIEKTNADDRNIDEMVQLLDRFAQSQTGRLKVVTSDELPKGETVRQHHLGRCDIGSPWAKGLAFDVLEDENCD